MKPFDSQDYFQLLNTQSSKYGLPYRITESNNIYGGGKAGASDVFAATLWALDLMWIIAENNGQGINFHDGRGLFYSPVIMDDGVAVAKPEYYAMLAFKYGSNGGTIIPVTYNNTNDNFSAYASANADNTYSVTLINKEESKNINFKIQLNKPASTIQIARLTAPSLTSANNISFAGNSVNADGTFVPGTLEKLTINQNNVVVNIPAGSAAVITIH